MSGAVTSGPDTMCLARDERADLADFLATLTPEQWDAPTLCTLWRVRDVVAHMFSYEDLGCLRWCAGSPRPGSIRIGSTPSASRRTPGTAPMTC